MTQDKIIETGKQVFADEISVLEESGNLLGEEFAEAAEILASAERIIITGVGKSGLVGRKIAATFASIGKPAYFIHPVDALHGDIGIVQPGDIVVMLSKSGSTEETVRLLPYIKSRSAKIIAMVSNCDSYLAHNADICLYMPVEREACPLNIVPTCSTTAAMAMGDALAVAVMNIRNVTLKQFSMQHPLGQIGRNITLKVKDIMHSGDKMPFVAENSSFKEALIVMSAKKLGCVCVCEENLKLVGIITDGDVRRTLHKFDNIGALKASDVMTAGPVTIPPEMFLGEALAVMSNRDSQISVLPVVTEENTLLGIIRVHDIIRSEM